LNESVRQHNLLQLTAWILFGVSTAAVCIAQGLRAVLGQPWNVPLTAASAVVAVIVLSSICRYFVFASRTIEHGSPSRVEVSQRAPRAHWLPGFLLWVVWWAATGVLVTAGLNWSRGTSEPLGDAAINGAILGIGTLFFMEARRRGWITGVFFAPQDDPKARSAELAKERDEILAKAKQSKFEQD
jgi:hypothetical protein